MKTSTGTVVKREHLRPEDGRKVWVRPELEKMELLNVKFGPLAGSEAAFPATGSQS